MGDLSRRIAIKTGGLLAGAVATVAVLAGCTAAPYTLPARPTAAVSPVVAPLPTGTGFDYQLGGSYDPPAGVGIVTRDSTDSPASGLYSICYVNGFQTQGGDKSFWLKKHPTLVLRYKNHKPVYDAGWPDEMLLDTSTAGKRAAIAKVIGVTISSCARKGFAAVEFDNLDSWTRSHHKLSKSDNIALATLLTKRSHHSGLAAGQKNTSELGASGRDRIGFDFAVAEQCYRYDECASYTDVYGDRVLDIEYTDDLRGTFAQACADPRTPAMTILRDIELTTPQSRHYVYEACPPK